MKLDDKQIENEIKIAKSKLKWFELIILAILIIAVILLLIA